MIIKAGSYQFNANNISHVRTLIDAPETPLSLEVHTPAGIVPLFGAEAEAFAEAWNGLAGVDDLVKQQQEGILRIQQREQELAVMAQRMQNAAAAQGAKKLFGPRG